MIDLHVHSYYSDGTNSPSELVNIALQNNITAFALTDHDTLEGIPYVTKAAIGTGIEIIPGVELSAENNGHDIHILGFYLDYSTNEFTDYIRHFREERDERNIKMCKKLTEAGYPISYEELKEAFPRATITRAHYGQTLMKKGYVKSIAEAFDRLIGDSCPYYIPRERLNPEAAIEYIHKAGGLATLAHPFQYKMGNTKLEEFVKQLKNAGLDGIEAKYTTHSPSEERQLKEYAKKYDLFISGGSDYHGEHKPAIMMGKGHGKLYIDESVLIPIKERKMK